MRSHDDSEGTQRLSGLKKSIQEGIYYDENAFKEQKDKEAKKDSEIEMDNNQQPSAQHDKGNNKRKVTSPTKGGLTNNRPKRTAHATTPPPRQTTLQFQSAKSNTTSPALARDNTEKDKDNPGHEKMYEDGTDDRDVQMESQ